MRAPARGGIAGEVWQDHSLLAFARSPPGLHWILARFRRLVRSLAPGWAQAIIPSSPGRERDATACLESVVESDEGLSAKLEGQLDDLGAKVAAKHARANAVEPQPDPLNPGDNNATATATPVDRVFGYGFDPLPAASACVNSDPRPLSRVHAVGIG